MYDRTKIEQLARRLEDTSRLLDITKPLSHRTEDIMTLLRETPFASTEPEYLIMHPLEVLLLTRNWRRLKELFETTDCVPSNNISRALIDNCQPLIALAQDPTRSKTSLDTVAGYVGKPVHWTDVINWSSQIVHGDFNEYIRIATLLHPAPDESSLGKALVREMLTNPDRYRDCLARVEQTAAHFLDAAKPQPDRYFAFQLGRVEALELFYAFGQEPDIVALARLISSCAILPMKDHSHFGTTLKISFAGNNFEDRKEMAKITRENIQKYRTEIITLATASCDYNDHFPLYALLTHPNAGAILSLAPQIIRFAQRMKPYVRLSCCMHDRGLFHEPGTKHYRVTRNPQEYARTIAHADESTDKLVSYLESQRTQEPQNQMICQGLTDLIEACAPIALLKGDAWQATIGFRCTDELEWTAYAYARAPNRRKNSTDLRRAWEKSRGGF